MVLINGDIFGQALFGTPIKGAIEIVSLSIVGIVFLQIAHSLRHGAFIRSDALFGVLRQRHPMAGGLVQAVYTWTRSSFANSAGSTGRPGDRTPLKWSRTRVGTDHDGLAPDAPPEASDGDRPSSRAPRSPSPGSTQPIPEPTKRSHRNARQLNGSAPPNTCVTHLSRSPPSHGGIHLNNLSDFPGPPQFEV